MAPDQAVALHYCKGNYFAYKGPGASVRRLVYPAPAPDLAGLGTHLTLSLNGDIRFGPDVEWLQPPVNSEDEDPDWWSRHLTPPDDRLDQVFQAVASYLPGVARNGFSADYSGIRPKRLGEGQGPSDFLIDIPIDGFVNLLGLESPGLTASLAIAEHVEGLIRRSVWGLGRGSGAKISETGNPSLEAWT